MKSVLWAMGVIVFTLNSYSESNVFPINGLYEPIEMMCASQNNEIKVNVTLDAFHKAQIKISHEDDMTGIDGKYEISNSLDIPGYKYDIKGEKGDLSLKINISNDSLLKPDALISAKIMKKEIDSSSQISTTTGWNLNCSTY